MAVVLLHDDYSPPSGVYYFRQSAFSQYNGRRLVQATGGDVDRDVLRRFPASAVDVPGALVLTGVVQGGLQVPARGHGDGGAGRRGDDPPGRRRGRDRRVSGGRR